MTLRMVWADRRQIDSQRRSTTFSSVANTSFRKPIRRSSFQICSMGFISGVYGGRKNNLMLSGSRRASDLCQAAPSQHSRIVSSEYRFESSWRKMLVHTVLQYGPYILGKLSNENCGRSARSITGIDLDVLRHPAELVSEFEFNADVAVFVDGDFVY